MTNKRSRALGLAVIGLLLAALIFRDGNLAWLSLPFLSYLGMGLFLAPLPDLVLLRACRFCYEIKREGASSIEVLVSLRNEGSRTVCASLADPLMRGMRLTEGALCLRTSLRPGEEAELRYVFETERGSYVWEKLRVKVEDPFGLFEFEASVKAEARILVQPRHRRLPSIPLRLQKTLSSPGSIPIRMGGSGTDFWGIREYRQGDPLKRLYWRLNARNPLRRYTKEFIQERTAEILLVLDGRQRMDIDIGHSSLFEREVAVVAALAGTLIRQGQRVGLFIMGTEPRNLFPDYGRIQLRRILNCLAEAAPASERTRETLRYLPTLRYSRSALMVIVSPYGKDDEPVFQRLRVLGYQAVLISPDTQDFARPVVAGDALTALALKVCRIERRLSLNRVSRLSFPVIDWRVDDEIAPLLKEALAHLARACRPIGWKI